MSANVNRGTYYPAIDGLRTLAVLAVVAYHGNKAIAPGGFLGVDVFFVISGFVITLTLLREHERTGRISLFNFYRRRFWRLTPAMLLAVALSGVLVVAAHAGGLWSYLWQAATGMTYTYNIAQVVTANRGGGILSHLWSLSAEEQFYLVWAPVLAVGLSAFVARRERLRAVAVGIMVFYAARIVTFLTMGPLAAFFLPWARFDQFLIGAAVAVTLHHGKGSAPGWVRSPWPSAGAVLAVTVACLLTADLEDGWLYFGGYTLVALLTAVIVAHCYSGEASFVQKFLGSKALTWLGARSYGIYLYHYPVVVAMKAMELPAITLIPVSLGAGVGLAALSYRFVEAPLRQRGHSATKPSRALVEAKA